MWAGKEKQGIELEWPNALAAHYVTMILLHALLIDHGTYLFRVIGYYFL